MSFASSSLQNSYKPDRRVLDAVNALATRVDALEAEKVILRAENAELLSRLELLYEWAKTLTTRESSGASG
jgi:hypothetical protein